MKRITTARMLIFRGCRLLVGDLVKIASQRWTRTRGLPRRQLKRSKWEKTNWPRAAKRAQKAGTRKNFACSKHFGNGDQIEETVVVANINLDIDEGTDLRGFRCRYRYRQ